jgi:hypothetical protein
MQNITFKPHGIMDTWATSPSGVVTYTPVNVTQDYVYRAQSGYTGKRPKVKPLPPHAYLLQCTRIHADNRANQRYSNGSTSEQRGSVLSTAISGLGFALLPTPNYAGLASEALDKLNDKVRGKLDVSIDLAQLPKTMKMLSATEQLVDYTKAFRSRFPLIKSASRAWLTYVYGIKPTLGTIFGCADENLRFVLNQTSRFRVRATGPVTPKFVSIPTVWGNINYPVTSSAIKASIGYGIDMRTNQFDLARWSSLNPLSIAWELLPYSFVVDWVFNIGGYLRNMETYLLYNNKFRGGYSTAFEAGKVTFELLDRATSGTLIYQNSFHKGFVEYTSIQRSILNSYPVPTLPSFDVKMGSSRMLSAAALLGQILGR